MRYAIAAIAALSVTGLLLWLGPRPLHLSEERTGDPELSARLADAAGSGHHHISAVLIDSDGARFAGLGADEHTEFEIGSVTKTFTAHILAERGLEETPVREIIDAQGSEIADITLRELADHTSGLPRLPGGFLLGSLLTSFTGANPYAGITREQVVDDALAASLNNRGKEEYSNLGVALLGQLLAIEADTTWEQLVDDHILTPAGMTDTYPMTNGSVPDDAPRGFMPTGKQAEPWELGGYMPTGGLRSTAADMARYATFVLDNGVPDYTWSTDDEGRRVHHGGTYGYSTTLIVDEEAGRAAYVAADTMAGVDEIALALLEVK
ncbi:MAG: serine hydrolase domain-containing protein [Corynebacterium sp.]|uniref:serine hydrolase domain-containing protein n=1 Tax=Corynebacterium sp. TaxID=1720 RepID=UPI0026DF414A|nr:serine hydrolase domain-containing protein [Corynebacterium sp.]MDO5670016.1 serine hydrolase domain-containing protein [Corynebacterium sp.]